MLSGIRLAKRMGANRKLALTDSRLTTNQIKEEFKARDKKIEKYMKVVQRLVKELKSFFIK